jgi:disulfide bond formation protein DsbB
MSASRAGLALIAALSLAAVGAAMVSQHVFGVQPCPWCVLQRLIYLAIAAAALLGLLLRPLQGLGAVLSLLLAVSGVATALWQHFVAAQSASCNLTLADRIVTSLGLDTRWPAVFMATASCGDPQVPLLGLPYQIWSLGLFVLLCALSVWPLRPGRMRG